MEVCVESAQPNQKRKLRIFSHALMKYMPEALANGANTILRPTCTN